MTAAADTSARGNPWLDMVRTLAIVLVMLRHGAYIGHGAQEFPGFWANLFLNGWIGVDLFFVLSGYLIARHLMRAGLGAGSFRYGHYMLLRALRILPAYLAALLLVVAGFFPGFRVVEDDLGWRIAYHLLFLQDYLSADINVVFWSLGVEEKFYLLAPVFVFGLMALGVQRKQLLAIGGLLAGLALMRVGVALAGDGFKDYYDFFRTFRSPFHMALEALLLGVTVAMAERGAWVRSSEARGLWLVVISFAVMVAWLGSHEFMAGLHVADAVFQPFGIALLAACLTLGAVMLADVRLPGSALFTLVAKLSYCLYLVHLPLLPLVRFLADGSGVTAFWLIFFALSLLAAVALHLVVERPFLQWKASLASRRVTIEAPVTGHP